MTNPDSVPANIPLASGGPPVIATRMVALRAEISRDKGYPPGRLVAWWQVLETLLDSYRATRGGAP